MAPNLSEEEIDDLIYLARAGEDTDLTEMLQELAVRDAATPAEVLSAAREEQGKATCLHMAAANGHARTVTLILSYLPVPTKTPAKATPNEASETTSSPAAKTEQSYIDAQNSFGNSALHWACLRGHLDIVKLLLSRGASPTLANEKDQIPLDLAAFNNHMHVVDYFLAQSKDIEGGNAQEGALATEARDLDMADDVVDEPSESSESRG